MKTLMLIAFALVFAVALTLTVKDVLGVVQVALASAVGR